MDHGPWTRGWPRAAAVMILMGAAALVPTAPNAQAIGCGTSGNYQVGWTTSLWPGSQPRQFEGVKAVLTDRAGYGLCTTNTSGWNTNSNWTAIHGANPSSYAQSGTLFTWNDSYCVRFFAEQSLNGAWSRTTLQGVCSQPGEAHFVWQQTVFDGGAWRIRSNIDQTMLMKSTWNPFATWGSPFQVLTSSETHYPESRIPGSGTAPLSFSNLEIQDRQNHSWYGTCGNANFVSYNQNSGLWGSDAPSCNYTRNWHKF